MSEEYQLVLTHCVINEVTGERFRLDEPLVVSQVFDRRYGGSPIILNRMFDEMKAFALAKMERGEE